MTKHGMTLRKRKTKHVTTNKKRKSFYLSGKRKKSRNTIRTTNRNRKKFNELDGGGRLGDFVRKIFIDPDVRRWTEPKKKSEKQITNDESNQKIIKQKELILKELQNDYVEENYIKILDELNYLTDKQFWVALENERNLLHPDNIIIKILTEKFNISVFRMKPLLERLQQLYRSKIKNILNEIL